MTYGGDHFALYTKIESLCCTVQFSSVARLSLTLCDSMDCSMPGLPVHHQLHMATASSCYDWWAVPLESGPLLIGYRKSGCSIIWWCQVLLLTHFWITVSERRCSRARDQGLFRQLTVEGPPHHCSYHSYREFSFRRKEQDLNVHVNTYFFFLFIKLRTMLTMKN